jgi:hypothetical protein
MLCHQPFPGNGFQQWRLFSFMRSGFIFTTSHAELPINWQLTTDWVCPIASKIIHRQGPCRELSSSIIVWVFISAGTCLPIVAQKRVSLHRLLRIRCRSSCRPLVTVIQQRVYTLQYESPLLWKPQSDCDWSALCGIPISELHFLEVCCL